MSSQGLCSREKNVANGGKRIITNGQPKDPRAKLEALVLAEHAMQYSVNLDGFVDRYDNFCVRGGYATVWTGTLHLNDAIAAKRDVARNCFLGDGDTANVNLLPTHDISL